MHSATSATLVEELQWAYEEHEYVCMYETYEQMDTDRDEVASLRWYGHHEIAEDYEMLIASGACDSGVGTPVLYAGGLWLERVALPDQPAK